MKPRTGLARMAEGLILMWVGLLGAMSGWLWAGEPPLPAYAGQVQERLDGYLLENRIPGVAAGVVFQGRFQPFTAGVRNRETGAPVTRETMFPLGSVTKVFTGIMMGYLVEEGRLRLEDAVVESLPERVAQSGGAIRQVTWLELATHTSGMTEPAVDNPAEQAYFDLPPAPELVTQWIDWKPTPPTGGDPYRYDYSNLGFLTLAFAVGDMGGRAGYNPLFDEVFRRPLGLSYLRTLGTMTSDLSELMSESYAVGEDPTEKVGNGVNANLVDLEPFLRACLLNEGVPAPVKSAIEISQRPYRSKLAANTNRWMGLGWDLRLAKPYRVSKGGATAGSFSFILLHPQENAGLVVMANGRPRSGSDIGRLAEDLMNLVLSNAPRELAEGRPVRTSEGAGGREVNDGDKTGNQRWVGAGQSSWWQVDLESIRAIESLHLLPSWEAPTAQRYAVSLSLDGEAWTEVMDARDRHGRDTLAGIGHRLAPRLARFVRVQGVDRALSLVEVEVFESSEMTAAALELARPNLEVQGPSDTGSSRVRYEYRRLVADRGLKYEVRISSDLREWQPMEATWGPPVVVMDPTGVSQVVRWEREGVGGSCRGIALHQAGGRQSLRLGELTRRECGPQGPLPQLPNGGERAG